jgi:hypothetical protein
MTVTYLNISIPFIIIPEYLPILHYLQIDFNPFLATWHPIQTNVRREYYEFHCDQISSSNIIDHINYFS